MTSADNLQAFKRDGRIVIVGASLAGLRAAETLREEGFTGSLTMIGDELGEPYDRPPLSKQVLTGWVPADGTTLPRRRDIDAEWLLGVPASGLDLAGNQVRLADGREIPFDRVLISTGVRARPWFVESEAALDGVFVLRTREHAEGLQRAIAAAPPGYWSSVPGSPAPRSPPSAANATSRSPSPNWRRPRWSARWVP